MPSLRQLFLLPLLLLLLACASSTPLAVHQSPAPAPTPMSGDACLTGDWTLTSATHSLTLPSGDLPVTGFAKTHLRIAPSGLVSLNYDDSSPGTGTSASSSLTQTLRGTQNFRLHATSGSFTFVFVAGTLTSTINNGGTLSTTTLTNNPPQTYTYTCNSTSLHQSSATDTAIFSRDR